MKVTERMVLIVPGLLFTQAYCPPFMLPMFGAVYYPSTLEKENLMTLLIRKYSLVCIFLFVPFLTKAQQNLADSLFSTQDYYQASLSYERALYVNDQPELRNSLLLKKTYCLKALSWYEEAYKNLLRANLFTDSDSSNFEHRYEIVLNAYLAGDYDIAYNHIKQLNHFIESEIFLMRAAYLEILILNEMLKWDEAKDRLVAYNTSHQVDINVDSLYEFLKKPQIRKLKKTESLATIAPGLVQVREGKVLQGLTSAAIRGSLVYLVIKELIAHYLFSGAFTGVAVYYLFYQGGVQYAIKLTQQRNAEKIEAYNRGIRNIILDKELSIINR